MSRTGLFALVVLASALALSACGRRGPLEPPPGGQTVPEDSDETEAAPAKPAAADAAPGTAQVRAGRGRSVPVQVPRRPFILDPLL